MNELKRNLDYYVKLPYGINLRQDDEGDWIARIEELNGCIAHGSTPTEAIQRIEEVKDVWLRDAFEGGNEIPEPQLGEALPSGKWVQRVPRTLHKRLTDLAKREGVSLNQLVTSVLAEAVGQRRTDATLPVSGTRSKLPHRETVACWMDRSDIQEVNLLYVGESESRAAIWNLEQKKPINNAIYVAGYLSAGASALPNLINEADFKVTELASKSKKEFNLKA